MLPLPGGNIMEQPIQSLPPLPHFTGGGVLCLRGDAGAGFGYRFRQGRYPIRGSVGRRLSCPSLATNREKQPQRLALKQFVCKLGRALCSTCARLQRGRIDLNIRSTR